MHLVTGNIRGLARKLPRNVKGYTLVEFMVAMALGLVIMLAVSEIFVNNSQARSEIERVSRQIENGRFALQLLSDEISNAGFFGESTGHAVQAAEPPVCVTTDAHARGTLALPIVGANDVASGDAPTCLGGFKAGEGYIAIRRASTCPSGSAGCDGFLEGHLHLQVEACQDPTGVITPANRVGSVVFATQASGMDALTRTCTAAAPIYRYLSRIYYLDDQNVLARAELVGSTYLRTPLVDGIERLVFEYGLDTVGNDGVADTYVSGVDADDWEDWADLVAVRITLIARSSEPTPGYVDGNTYRLPGINDYMPNDGFKRNLYSAVVRVNNLAGRRE